VFRESLAPQLPQPAAHVWVLHPVRAVFIPGEGRPTRTAAWLELRHVRAAGRIVDLLVFPSDDPVFHKHLPAAGTGAVDAVRRSDDLVMGPALAVHVLPVPAFLLKDRPIPRVAFHRL